MAVDRSRAKAAAKGADRPLCVRHGDECRTGGSAGSAAIAAFLSLTGGQPDPGPCRLETVAEVAARRRRTADLIARIPAVRAAALGAEHDA